MAHKKATIEKTVDSILNEGIGSNPIKISGHGPDSMIIKPENEDAEWLVNSSDGSILVTVHSASEDEFTHHLDRIPEGFKIRDIRGFAHIIRGSTAWTKKKIYLIADADVQAKITIY